MSASDSKFITADSGNSLSQARFFNVGQPPPEHTFQIGNFRLQSFNRGIRHSDSLTDGCAMSVREAFQFLNKQCEIWAYFESLNGCGCQNIVLARMLFLPRLQVGISLSICSAVADFAD